MNSFSKLCISALVAVSLNNLAMEPDEKTRHAQELEEDISIVSRDISNAAKRYNAQKQKIVQCKTTGFLEHTEMERLNDLEQKIEHHLHHAQSSRKTAQNILKDPLAASSKISQKAKISHANVLALLDQYQLNPSRSKL